MPGFFGVVGSIKKTCFVKETKADLLSGYISGDSFFIGRNTINKFLQDKPFLENEDYILLVEGVVLNRLQLEAGWKTKIFLEAIISSYKEKGESFFNEFRGSFSGLFFDKKKQTWLIFTNHIGDKQVFYSERNGTVIFGSEMGYIVNYCKGNDLPINLNEEAAYMLLTYGFFIENHTIVCEIKKLNAGHYLKIANGKATVIQYHQFTNEPDKKKTEEDFIEDLDHYFRSAVKLQFDKDIEYGYKHITTLSGGLDSRMTVWVAHEMGYTQQLNTTFSQSNYIDEQIAKQIATDLKHEFLFKALDHGMFLKNMDPIAKITYGGAVYYGLAHGKSLYDLLDMRPFGIMHTGQIGDAIIGTFYKKPEPGAEYHIGDGAYSITLIDRLKEYSFVGRYPNKEIFCLYSRAFTGANQGLLIFQEKAETVSPFCDVEFISYCYSIPVEFRLKHKIYINWILKKHPDAADYVWERIRTKIEPVVEQKKISIFGRNVPQDQIFNWLIKTIKKRIPFRKIQPIKSPLDSPFHMNPFDYWYRTNDELKLFMDQYFSKHLDLITHEQIKKDCQFLYDRGNVSEKTQVLTLLSAIKIVEV